MLPLQLKLLQPELIIAFQTEQRMNVDDSLLADMAYYARESRKPQKSDHDFTQSIKGTTNDRSEQRLSRCKCFGTILPTFAWYLISSHPVANGFGQSSYFLQISS